MTIYNYSQLNETHIDTLREIGSIGSGNAATSLAQMLNKEVNIKVPEVRIITSKDAISSMGGADNIVVGMLVNLTGDIEGVIMFMMKKEFVHLVISSIFDTSIHDLEQIKEIEMSAITEIGNIMISSYINSIAALTDMRVTTSIPYTTIDMTGAILDSVMAQFESAADKVIFIKDNLYSKEESIQSHMLLLPDIKSLNSILKKLGIEI